MTHADLFRRDHESALSAKGDAPHALQHSK
jgi:hypothetical protein